MIDIDRTVEAFSAVASNPIKHQQHRAITEPFWPRKKLKPSTAAPGKGLQIISSFIGELRPRAPVVQLQSSLQIVLPLVSAAIAVLASALNGCTASLQSRSG